MSRKYTHNLPNSQRMQNLQYAADRLQQVRHRIAQAEQCAGRTPDSVRLIGASKKQTAELLQAFCQNGLSDLGENYLQEALDKKEELTGFSVNWHFIGAIQSNKTALIARNFDWVHSVDRQKIARRLAEQFTSTEVLPKLNILLQINLDNEDTKAGITAQSIRPTLESIQGFSNIDCRGFMLIPAPRDSALEQRKIFATARSLLEDTNQEFGLQMDSLSMGMSNDLEAAIAEGSTMIRIGTDLFGARPAS